MNKVLDKPSSKAYGLGDSERGNKIKKQWKPIQGYEGHYEISNYGDVKSLGRFVNRKCGGYWHKERILKKTKTTTGYWKVELQVSGKRKSLRVHRLVAEAFIPNPDNKPNINHKDGNPLNNFVGNLEWCTQRENVIHAIETGLKKQVHIPKTELIRLYCDKKKSQKEIGRIYGVTEFVVRDRLKRYGIKQRTQSQACTVYNLSKEFILSELKTKTQSQLARKVGCNPSLISIYVKRIREWGDIYVK